MWESKKQNVFWALESFSFILRIILFPPTLKGKDLVISEKDQLGQIIPITLEEVGGSVSFLLEGMISLWETCVNKRL